MNFKRDKCAAPSCSRYTRGNFRLTVSTNDSRVFYLYYCTKKHMNEAVRSVVA